MFLYWHFFLFRTCKQTRLLCVELACETAKVSALFPREIYRGMHELGNEFLDSIKNFFLRILVFLRWA